MINKVFLFAFFAIALSLFNVGSAVGQSGGEKLIQITRDLNPPVGIESIGTKTGPLKVNEPFSAGRDWLKGLRFTVRNLGKNRVNYVSLGIRFPRPEGGGAMEYVDSIAFGESPIPTRTSFVLSNTVTPLSPNESIDLRITSADHARIRLNLEERGYSSAPASVKVYVSTIGFVDGTIWMAGRYYKFDKERPGRLIPQKASWQ